MKRKTLNPFKLWGTYIGFVVGVFLTTIINFARSNSIVAPSITDILSLVSSEIVIVFSLFAAFLGYTLNAIHNMLT